MTDLANQQFSAADQAWVDGFLARTTLFLGPDPEIMTDHRMAPRTAEEEHRFSTGVGSWNNAFMAGCFLNLLRIGNGRFEEALDNLNAARRNGWTAAEALIDVSQRTWISEIREDHDEYDRSVGDGDAELRVERREVVAQQAGVHAGHRGADRA